MDTAIAVRGFAWCLLASVPCFAQRAGTATLGGTAARTQAVVQIRVSGAVSFADGFPAADVPVTTGVVSTQSDAGGFFSLTQLATLGDELVVTAATRIVGASYRGSSALPVVSSRLVAGTIVLEPRSVPIDFAPLVHGGSYTAFAAADFDGDTDLDLVANRGTTAFVVVRNGGDGFEELVETTGLWSQAFHPLDLDLDGDIDLLMRHQADSLGRTLSAFSNDGSGDFGAQLPVGDSGWSFVPGDFDQDGLSDVVVAGSGTLSFLRGLGDGTFAAPQVQSGPLAPASVLAADLDLDGDLDLALRSSAAATIALGDGDGTFAALPPFGFTLPALELVSGDLDGDGVVDLLARTSTVSPFPALKAEPFLGQGDGTFTAAAVTPLPSSSKSVRLGDFDHDGDADLLQALVSGGAFSSGSLTVQRGMGDGTFFPSLDDYLVGSSLSSPLLDDFDADGELDAIVIGGGIVILLGRGDGTLDFPVGLNDTADTVSAADFDADGDLDLLRMDYIDDRVELSSNDGSGTFTGVGPAVTVSHPQSGAAGDLDGDADLDVVVAHDTSIDSLLHDGAFHLSSAASFTVGDNPVPALADFDLDGDLDLAVSSWSAGGVLYLYPGNGDGTFGTRSTWSIGGQPRTLVASDWDADLQPDVAVQTQAPLRIVHRGGNGDGTFQAAVEHFAAGRLFGPSSACDVDADGALDLLTEHEVLLGDGNGQFDPALPLGLDADGVHDLDDDGLVDLVRTTAGAVKVFAGIGDGTFPARRLYLEPYDPFELPPVLGDFDGDGDADVLLIYGTFSYLMRGRRVP